MESAWHNQWHFFDYNIVLLLVLIRLARASFARAELKFRRRNNRAKITKYDFFSSINRIGEISFCMHRHVLFRACIVYIYLADISLLLFAYSQRSLRHSNGLRIKALAAVIAAQRIPKREKQNNPSSQSLSS